MARKILVYGGRSSLGEACIKYFTAEKWWVGNVDSTSNNLAPVNIVPKKLCWIQQETEVVKKVGLELQGSKLDAIICVAGEHEDGDCAHQLSKTADKMWKQSVWSSTIAASIATKFLGPGGLLVLTGSKVALDPTPQAIGYGMAKAAVHHLTSCLACENSGLPAKCAVVGILPETLDTEVNRKMNPLDDADDWTSLNDVAKLIDDWTRGIDKPPNGSLVTILTRNKKTIISRYQIEAVKSICE